LYLTQITVVQGELSTVNETDENNIVNNDIDDEDDDLDDLDDEDVDGDDMEDGTQIIGSVDEDNSLLQDQEEEEDEENLTHGSESANISLSDVAQGNSGTSLHAERSHICTVSCLYFFQTWNIDKTTHKSC